LRFSLTYGTFLLLLFLNGSIVFAQPRFEHVSFNMANQVEDSDTLGFSNDLQHFFISHTKPDATLLMTHIIAAQYEVVSGKFPQAEKDISAYRHLDSLLHGDSLSGLMEYVEGAYYFNIQNYPVALSFLNKAALRFNNTANQLFQARCFVIRGLIFYSLRDGDFGEKNFLLALPYFHKTKSSKREAALLNNLALIKIQHKDSAGAIYYLSRSLAIRDSIHDLIGVGQSYNNLGALMFDFGYYEKALEYYQEGFEFRKKGNALQGALIESNINIGKTLSKLGKDNEALSYLEPAFILTAPIEKLELRRQASKELMEIYVRKKDFQKAFDMQKTYYFAQDSLYGVSKKEEMVRLNAQYNFDHKQQQDSLRRTERDNAQKILQNEKDKRSNFIMIVLVAGLLGAGLFVYFLYQSNAKNKKNNRIISAQRDILDKKQQEITESIRYAQFIQEALLPSMEALRKNLPEHFILYRPKDIVSGDFYWHWNAGDAQLLAVADCTGHGVPGAFMSLLGKESLDKSAAVSGKPGEILSLLNRSVKQSLKQNAEARSSRDGMDIALLKISNFAGKQNVIYSGANRPLWIFSRKEKQLTEIKATKSAIGGFTPDEQEFAETNIEIFEGDTIYLFTDGYADQFGGEKEKKMTTKKFRELLKDIQQHPLEIQKQKLDTFFNEWKGSLEQVDDILVIGIQF
jgi:serine phosphatase RsbU (regulator of sigma subunit)